MKALLGASLAGVLAACAGAGANPEAAFSYVEAGQEAAVRKDWKGAIDQYGRAIHRNPELAEAYYHRGYAYIQLRLDREAPPKAREYEDRALWDYSMALSKNPAFADAYHNRAMLYGSRAQYKAAAEDLLNATRFKPNDPEPHLELARLYEERFEDKIVLAFEHYEKYMDLGGKDPDAVAKGRHYKERKPREGTPQAPAKAPTPEEEKAALELHQRTMALLRDEKKEEAVKALEELLVKYAHTKYVQGQALPLNALRNYLKK